MKLAESDVAEHLLCHPGWTRRGDAIEREYTFPAFPDAIAFTTRLAFAAEATDHHPDLTIAYRRVAVRWTTHSDGGLTEKDFAGAAESDRIAAAFRCA
jgi:4a-hydroxytetrahydrobiopterin dehydratase